MTISNAKSALLLFAHGSSDPGWAAPFDKLKVEIQSRDPERIVELAYLERMQPSFEAAVATLQAHGVKAITIAPIFLAIGGHMRNDLPKLIEETQLKTGIAFRVLPALGEVEMLLGAIADWVIDAAKQT
ncbi:MAG: CbiX/SirB N-terminal domain-containing protein [Betaproteobacteria bacterium]